MRNLFVACPFTGDRKAVERMFDRLEHFAEPLPGTTAWPNIRAAVCIVAHHLRLVMSRNS
jgi:hypothetical protein